MPRLQIGYYAKLIQRGNMLLEEVPADVRPVVETFMKTGKMPEAETYSLEYPVVAKDGRNGALVLPEMSTCGISVEDLKAGVPVYFEGRNEVIFNKTEPIPTGVRYEVALVENTTGYFVADPEVTVTNTDDGFRLMIHGQVKEGAEYRGARILRVDLAIYSNNYHDMRITLYFCGL